MNFKNPFSNMLVEGEKSSFSSILEFQILSIPDVFMITARILPLNHRCL